MKPKRSFGYRVGNRNYHYKNGTKLQSKLWTF